MGPHSGAYTMKHQRTLYMVPIALLGVAIVLLAAFTAAQNAGWRSHTSFLSLTFLGDLAPSLVARRGMIYLILYFCTVLVVPVLSLAACMLVLWNKADQRNREAHTIERIL